MSAATEHLVRVTLELGGQRPAIINAETSANAARFSRAVRRIINGKVLNAGQTCIAPDYVLLRKDATPRFIAEARDIRKTHIPTALRVTTSPASPRTGTSSAQSNPSWRPLRREQKPA